MPNDRSGLAVSERASARSAVLPEHERSPSALRLLEAATIAFAERGYHGVSVRDLSSAVGIKAASFYAHFPSKESLLADLMMLGHGCHQQHVRDAILGAGSEPADQLRAGVRANVTFQATYPLLVIVANSDFEALTEHSRQQVMALRHDSGVLFAAVIDRGNATGAFRCSDPWLALSAIAAMGIRVAWWYRPPELRGEDSPLHRYPNEARTWLPEADYDVDTIADAYADFALRIVGAT